MGRELTELDFDPTDKPEVQRAKTRAALHAFLNNNPGEHPVHSAAEAVGLYRSTAGQHLAHMADSGLIKVRKDGTSKLYSVKDDAAPASAAESHLPKVRRQRRTVSETPQEVELVMAGMTIVLGRAANGRLRIVLEEGALAK